MDGTYELEPVLPMRLHKRAQTPFGSGSVHTCHYEEAGGLETGGLEAGGLEAPSRLWNRMLDLESYLGAEILFWIWNLILALESSPGCGI